MRCARGGRRQAPRAAGSVTGLHGQGAVHARDLPAQRHRDRPAAPGVGATCRQLDRVTRKLLARAGVGALPERHRTRRGAVRHDRPRLDGRISVRRYGPRPRRRRLAPRLHGACAAITRSRRCGRDLLMARLREGRANTARFLRETVARVRDAGARAVDDARRQRLLQPRGRRRLPRAGCPLLGHDPPAAERTHADRGDPQEDWTPIPYWLPGGAAVAETTYTPFQHTGDATAVRLIVRRVKPTPGSQGALREYRPRLHHRSRRWRPTIAARRDRERDPRPQVRRRAEPSARRPLRRERGVARGAGDRAQPRPLDGTAGARRGNRHDQDAQAALLRSRRTAHPLGPALDPAPPEALALGRAAGSRARAATGDTAPGLTPAHSAGPGPRLAPACPRAPRAPSRPRPQRPRAAPARSGTARRTPAHPPNSPAARHPAPSSFDRWIWGKLRRIVPFWSVRNTLFPRFDPAACCR